MSSRRSSSWAAVICAQDKNLQFRKLKLVAPGGQTYEDTDPDADDDAIAAAAAIRVVLPTKPTLEDAPEVWRQTRRVMETNLDQLKAVVRKEFAADSSAAADIEKGLKRMDLIVDTLDDELAASLTRAAMSRKPARLATPS